MFLRLSKNEAANSLEFLASCAGAEIGCCLWSPRLQIAAFAGTTVMLCLALRGIGSFQSKVGVGF